MATSIRPETPGTLAAALTAVRRRWRIRNLAAGLALVVAAIALTVWSAAWAMESMRFSADSVRWARLAVGLVAAGAAVRWILFPLLRRVADEQMAMYVEERVPSLDGALISAVEVGRQPADEAVRSSLLTTGLITDAVRRISRSAEVEGLERSATTRSFALAALLMAGLAGLIALGPSYLRQGARLLVTPWQDAALAPVYSISVEPGDATVPRGSDVQINARLSGFASELVEVAVRRGEDAEWERIAMGLGPDSTQFTARLFDVAENAEYYVESNGVRSAVSRLTVRNLPAVSGVDVDLRYPAYTGLPPEEIKDGGDITALAGTRATITVRTTMGVKGARLVLDDSSTIAMSLHSDTLLQTTIVVRRDGFYRVELEAADGSRIPGSVEYVVDALEDAEPSVSISKPGRDIRPSAVDEVFVEVNANDDYGVGRIDFVYRVNGGEEKVVNLANGSGSRPREMTAGHTLFLEEYGLQPGDVVSYYARAWDNDAVKGAKRGASDIYFLTIRPFSREYRQNQEGGQPGAANPGENPGELVQLQREVIAATYKADRDSARTPAAKFRTDVATIHLSQGRLRQQLADLIARVSRPAAMAADTVFRQLAELLPNAETAMKKAEAELLERKLKSAMPAEQEALQWLERGEALFRDVQLSMQQGQQGGGGGSQAQANDLADLLELENDKLRNQYEQVQRGSEQQQQQQAAAIDSTLEELRRLAARQQQENERARQRGTTSNNTGSGGGGSQRQLAEEAEQLGRQLERLAREQESQGLQEAARRLQDAANQMRRSAANGNSTSQSSSAAMDQLEEARRLLNESRQNRLDGGLEEATRRAQQLAAQQREVARGVEQLPRAGADRGAQQQRLLEQKAEMEREARALEGELDQLAREQRREQGGAARQLQEAARIMREGRIADYIQLSRRVIQEASPEYANGLERKIQTDLDSLVARVGSVATTSRQGNDSTARAERALAQARNLVRGLTSLDERMRERTRADSARSAGGESGQQQSGERGQQGQQGQGQQGPGQQGQGQQGQGQQGQGQQGQGQQGQGQQGQGQQGQGQQGQGQQGQGQQGQQSGGGQGQRGEGGQGRRLADGETPQGQPGMRSGQIGGGGQGISRPGGGNFSSEDIRQFGREFRNQREAAEALRRELANAGVGTADLERVMARLRELESGRAFNDPEELERLKAAVLEGVKEFEFGLRRQLGAAAKDGPVLGGSADVPQAYRDLVSEYFKSLSRKKQ
ncbi:MAG: DUF4175 family protein [Gemmatimonadota bacterium]